MHKNGNVLIFSVFLIAAVLVIFLFIMLIFMSEVNAYLYNFKLDMYSINKSAIIAVNKGITSRESFSYDSKTYQEYFEEMLKKNYKLDENLENTNGVVQAVTILEYNIVEAGKKDGYTKRKLKDNTIHSVIKIKVKPIFSIKQLERLFTFEIHEDVVLNVLNM